MGEDRFDIVLFGVTGYTGELALRYLASLPSAERGRIAVAGRDEAKLVETCRRVSTGFTPEVLVADAEDADTIDAMVRRASVVVNLAGPYTMRGPVVVERCVAHGTHYVDLTGEPLFVRDMIREHHAAAAERRVRIVHCGGFESLPFDMTTLFAVSALQQHKGVSCHEVELSLEMKVHDRAVLRDAALSGGTVATILLLLESDGGFDLVDPAVLLPEAMDDVQREAIRQRHPLPTGARRDPLTGSWATPVFPAPTLNPQVILRSAALYADAGGPYGPQFRYREVASLQGLVPRLAQRAAAGAISVVLNRVTKVLQGGASWQRRGLAAMVTKLGAQSGGGPRHELLDRFDYGLVAKATGPGGESVTVAYEGRGNPGYLSTAQMVVQAGLALAFDGQKLPQLYGVLTPAAGLGLGFSERLQRAGVVMRVVS